MPARLVLAPCNKCRIETNHHILHKEIVELTGRDTCDAEDNEVYALLKCAGCGSITLRVTEPVPEFSKKLQERSTRHRFYPPRIHRSQPQWIYKISIDSVISADRAESDHLENVYGLLSEVYIAIQNDCPRLAAMGARSLLDSVMTYQLGDIGGFEKKLDSFTPEYISSKQKRTIKQVLDLGHAATHRGFKPSRNELDVVVDILEGVVRQIYIDPDLSHQISERVPGRSR